MPANVTSAACLAGLKFSWLHLWKGKLRTTAELQVQNKANGTWGGTRGLVLPMGLALGLGLPEIEPVRGVPQAAGRVFLFSCISVQA